MKSAKHVKMNRTSFVSQHFFKSLQQIGEAEMLSRVNIGRNMYIIRASDFFQDWWAKVTHGAKNGGPFSEMIGPMPKHIKLNTVDNWVVYFTYTLTQTLVCIYVY